MVGVFIDDTQALTFLGLLVIADKTELSFYFVNFCLNLDFFLSVCAKKLEEFFIQGGVIVTLCLNATKRAVGIPLLFLFEFLTAFCWLDYFFLRVFIFGDKLFNILVEIREIVCG
jgi:hypothetical protein